jgi:hypothetical protein
MRALLTSAGIKNSSIAAPGAGKSVALGNVVSNAALCTDVSVGSNCHRPSRRCTSCSWRPDPRGPRSPSRRCRASRGTARTSGSGSGDQRGMELMRTTHPRSVIAQQSCPGSRSMKVLRRSWWEWTFAPMDPSNQNRSEGESACAHALMYKAFSRSWLLRVGLALRPLLGVVGSQNPPMAADGPVAWPTPAFRCALWFGRWSGWRLVWGLCEVPVSVLTFCGLRPMSYDLRHGAT